ncbi:MAG: PRC-barrel domain-containing protein [Thermomicrobiales bacterium]
MKQTIQPGQDVRDEDGERIGTVNRVYRETNRETLITEPVGGESRFGSGYLEVGAQLSSLEQPLYIPFSEILDASERGIRVNVHSDSVANRDWNLRPAFLDEPQWQSVGTNGP